MFNVIRTGRRLQLLSESSHILGEGLVVQVADPVVPSPSCDGVLVLANSIPRCSRCCGGLLDRDRDGLGRAAAAASGDVGAGRCLGWGEGTGRRGQDEKEGCGSGSSVAEGHHVDGKEQK